MRVLVFGTYDQTTHPRVGILADGLRRHGAQVSECNAPLGIDTAGRVAMLRQPWRVPLLLVTLLRRWATLVRRARHLPRADVVLVGYLGHFDVLLARLLFRRSVVVLDHLVGAADTARDRGESGGLKQWLLRAVDDAALRAAHVVVVDTEEHRTLLPEKHRRKGVVAPVGAPPAWFQAARPGSGDPGHPLRVVFFGLFTPLQGAPVIGEALALLADRPIHVTMVGSGQDLARTRAAAAPNPLVTWRDWVPAAELPELVAAHDVCLGIFGTGPKAARVVPNKVFQGAAAGCAIVTADTPPQRRMLGDAAAFVPAGDARALADALGHLSDDRTDLARLRDDASTLARKHFSPEHVVEPLLRRLTPSVEGDQP